MFNWRFSSLTVYVFEDASDEELRKSRDEIRLFGSGRSELLKSPIEEIHLLLRKPGSRTTSFSKTESLLLVS